MSPLTHLCVGRGTGVLEEICNEEIDDKGFLNRTSNKEEAAGNSM